MFLDDGHLSIINYGRVNDKSIEIIKVDKFVDIWFFSDKSV